MNQMKRLIACVLMLCMLVPAAVTAEEEEDELLADFTADFVVDGSDAVDASADDEDAEEVYIPEEDEELVSAVEILDAEIDDSVDPSKLDINENLPDNVVNILLIGVDGRSEDLATGTQHGDVQIIVSINKDDGSIKMTSVLRDLYVTIPGYKSKNRINVAYARGGGQLAMRTMNNLLELNIQHYVVINFYGLASIIDSLGGIDIELTKAEANAINTYINKNLKKGGYDNQEKGYKRQALEKKDGVQHLDGIQAVMYARLRSIDNDFARTARQRHLLELLLRQIMQDMTLDKLIGLIETCVPYVTTNVNLNTMLELGMTVLGSGMIQRAQQGETLIEQHRVPMDKTYSYKDINGASVVYMGSTNFPKNVQALHEFIYGAYYPAD